MAATFDPYHVWLGIRPKDQPPNHYRLLGLELFENDLDAITHAVDSRMAHLRSLQTGSHGAQAARLLNELAVAGRCLLNENSKSPYDARLRNSLQPRVEPAILISPPVPGVQVPPPPEPVRTVPAESSVLPQFVVPSRGQTRKGDSAAWIASILAAVCVAVVGIVSVVIWLLTDEEKWPPQSSHEAISIQQSTTAKTQELSKAIVLKETSEDEDAEALDENPGGLELLQRFLAAKEAFDRGDRLRGEKKNSEALVHFQQAREILGEFLSEQPEDEQFLAIAGKNYNALGITLMDLGRIQEAEQTYRDGIFTRDRLYRLRPDDVNNKMHLAGMKNNLGMAIAGQGRDEEALPLYQEAVLLQKAVLTRNPNQQQSRRFLRNHYANLAESLLRLERTKEASAAAQKVANLYPADASDSTFRDRILAKCKEIDGTATTSRDTSAD